MIPFFLFRAVVEASFPGNGCHELEICNFFVSMYHQDFLEDLWDRIQILSSNGWRLNSGMVETSILMCSYGL